MEIQNNFALNDIPGFNDFKSIEPINEGLSIDKKYYVETTDGRRLLLRISDISEYTRKKTTFNMMKRISELSIPMCVPLDFGTCSDGKNVYLLMTWCDGENLETILPSLSESEQYALGLKSGEALCKIHSIPAPDNTENWAVKYVDKTRSRMKAFSKCDVQIEGSDTIFRYFEDNKHLLNDRPQCLRHGDYHNGNFLVVDNRDLFVIDWEMYNYGDPWEEFSCIGYSEVIPHFTTGFIRGYFGGEPPEEFWRLVALYLSAGALMLVSWAYYTQKDCLESCLQNANDILHWLSKAGNPVPPWYLNGFHA